MRLNPRLVGGLGTALLVTALSHGALGSPVFWDPSVGGNGHLYEAFGVPGGISWPDADSSARAIAPGWHLVTITSQAENDFVFDLVDDDPSLWYLASPGHSQGPWLGGYLSDWQWLWVTGEDFVYSNWAPWEPFGNGQMIGFFGYYAPVGDQWNDIGPSGDGVLSYIAENDDASGVNPSVPLSTCSLTAAPSPFCDFTTLYPTLASPGDIAIDVLNIQGRIIITLTAHIPAGGALPIRWDGRDENGRETSPGVYFIRLVSQDAAASKTVVRVR